jgi:hypothetical protein
MYSVKQDIEGAFRKCLLWGSAVVLAGSQLFFIAAFGLQEAAAAPLYPEWAAVDGDGQGSSSISISQDGRYVLYKALSDNKYYVRDRQDDSTAKISTDSSGQDFDFAIRNPRLSGDGSTFFFVTKRGEFNPSDSRSGDLDLYKKNLVTGVVEDLTDILAPITSTWLQKTSNAQAINFNYASNDGRFVAYTVQSSGACGNQLCSDTSVYRLDTINRTYNAILPYYNVFILGQPQLPIDGFTALAISGDGEYVVYGDSIASPRDVGAKDWRVDVSDGTKLPITERLGITTFLTNDDGRYVAFAGPVDLFEDSPNCPDDSADPVCTAVYRKDVSTGALQRVSEKQDATVPEEYVTSNGLAISGDGNTLLWTTRSILRSTKTQHARDQVYGKDMQTGAVHVVSVAADLAPASGSGVATGNLGLTTDGSEALLTAAALNFGNPFNCQAAGGGGEAPLASIINPGDPIPCSEVFVVSGHPADIVDTQAPTVISLEWEHDPSPIGSIARLQLDLADDASGPAGGEFFFDSDPGLGNAQDINYDVAHNLFEINVTDSAVIENPGTYTMYYRVYDNVGNWGPLQTTSLTVGNASPETFSLFPAADTYVRGGNANHNQGGDPFMQIQSSGNNRALVRFDQSALASIVSNGTVLSATLRLTITDNGNNWGASGRTVDVHRLLLDWAEGNGTQADRGTNSGATWNCAADSNIQNQVANCSGNTAWEMGQPNNAPVHPWLQAPTATQTIANNQAGVVEYDVTTDVVDFLSGAAPNYGWIIKKTNENQNGMVGFGTKEGTAQAELVITYQP